jgi:hypothetical protein
MIEIFRIPIPKAKLRTMPSDDRHLLLLASHAVNQISVVQKMLLFSVHHQPDSSFEKLLSAAQSQTILRLLFGVLAESWELVKRPINQRLIGIGYVGAIDSEGIAEYRKLKKHFGASSLLHRLRNTIAYHHPSSEELEAAFEDVPERAEWAWYASDRNQNSFYFASDMVISAGALRVTGETDPAKAFDKIMREVLDVSETMVDFLLYVMRAIIARHLGAALMSPRAGTGVRIDNAPELHDVSIPFFTEANKRPRR